MAAERPRELRQLEIERLHDRPLGTENAGDSFKDMIERIRSRYMLAYHAPDASPGTFRHITVTLDDAAKKRYPGAELHSRSGYYAE